MDCVKNCFFSNLVETQSSVKYSATLRNPHVKTMCDQGIREGYFFPRINTLLIGISIIARCAFPIFFSPIAFLEYTLISIGTQNFSYFVNGLKSQIKEVANRTLTILQASIVTLAGVIAPNKVYRALNERVSLCEPYYR